MNLNTRSSKIVGISGCTNGGKTTLAKRLLAKYPNSFYLSQDDFYHPRDSGHLQYIPELQSFNFDVISAIDMKKLHRKLEKLIKSGKYEYIILDGILLFEDEKLLKMLDKKYFVVLDKDECYRRRQTRNYKTLDTENYFDGCVYPEYMKYKHKCESSIRNIIYLNGADSPDVLFNFVMSDLKF